jgi:hypothetical protein
MYFGVLAGSEATCSSNKNINGSSLSGGNMELCNRYRAYNDVQRLKAFVLSNGPTFSTTSLRLFSKYLLKMSRIARKRIGTSTVK